MRTAWGAGHLGASPIRPSAGSDAHWAWVTEGPCLGARGGQGSKLGSPASCWERGGALEAEPHACPTAWRHPAHCQAASTGTGTSLACPPEITHSH